jgi:hypothetical protein
MSTSFGETKQSVYKLFFCRFYAHCRHESSGTAGDLPGTAPRIQQVTVLSILIEHKNV